MRLYIYLVEVIHQQGWWVTTATYSNGRTEIVSQDMWKWVAVRNARKLCRGVAVNQGDNKRLELQVRNKDGRIAVKDSYGHDPRSIHG